MKKRINSVDNLCVSFYISLLEVINEIYKDYNINFFIFDNTVRLFRLEEDSVEDGVCWVMCSAVITKNMVWKYRDIQK